MKLPKRPAMVREAAEKGGQKWYLEILIFLGVFAVATAVESIPSFFMEFIRVLQTGEIFPETIPEWYMVISLFSTGLMTLAVILFCRWVQKRNVRSLGFRREGAVTEYVVGALAGATLFGGAMLICVLTRSVKLTTQTFSVGLWLLYLIGFLIQGMSEEVLCRGYFMVSIARKNHLALAVFLSSLAFSLLHIANSGVTVLALFNIFLFGVLTALYVLRRGNLWGVCAMHSLWNFVQGNVFGVSVSGTGSGASPLTAELTEQGKLWNGGSFGAEGGLAVTIMLTIGILMIIFVMKDHKESVSPIATALEIIPQNAEEIDKKDDTSGDYDPFSD